MCATKNRNCSHIQIASNSNTNTNGGGEQSVEARCGSTKQEQGEMGEHDKQNAGLYLSVHVMLYIL